MPTSKTQLVTLADRFALTANSTNGPEIWRLNQDTDGWVKASNNEVVSGGPLVISEKTTNTQTIESTQIHQFNTEGTNPYPIPPPPPPPKPNMTFTQIQSHLESAIGSSWVLDY
jgi:hypothetical protein